MVEAALIVIVGNLIVRLRAAAIRNAHALSDLNGLHRIDAHDGLCQPSVQTRLPTDVRTKAEGNATSNHFECSANRIAVFLGLFDFTDHLLADLGQDATYNLVIPNRLELLPRHHEVVRDFDRTNRSGMAENLDTEMLQ